jgi:hypothetical protein
MNLVSAPVSLMGKEGGQFFLVPVIAGTLMIIAFICAFKMSPDGVSEKE